MSFSRHLVSRRTGGLNPTCPFGQGSNWYHSFHWKLSGGEGGEVTIRQPSGYVCTYMPIAKSSKGYYWAKHPFWRGEKLRKLKGKFVLLLKDTSQVIFEPRAGEGGLVYVATKVIDPRFCETHISYNDMNLCDTVTLPGGASFQFSYETLPSGLTVTSEVSTHDGRSVRYEYKHMKNKGNDQESDVLSRVVYPDGGDALYTYSYHPHAEYVLPPLLKTARDRFHTGPVDHIRYTWGKVYGTLVSERTHEANEILLNRIAGEDKITVRNGSGDETYYVTDPEMGGMSTVVDTCGGLRKWVYDPENRYNRFPVKFLDAEQSETEFTRSANGNIMQECSPVCTVTDFKRDLLGRVTQKTVTPKTGRKRVTRYKYSYPGGLTKIDYPDGTSEEWFYSFKDHTRVLPYKHILRDGSEEFFHHDDYGRKIRHIDPTGAITSWEYYPSGLVKAEISPTWVKTQYEYDDFGQKTKEILNDGSYFTFSYDERGNFIQKTDSTDRVWAWTYDHFSRQVTATGPTDAVTSYSYDDLKNGGCGSCSTANNPTQIVSPEGRITRFSYDGNGRRIRIIRGAETEAAETTLWTYDCRGNVLKTTHPNGRVDLNSYDQEGRLVSVIKDSGTLNLTTSLVYDDFGNVIERSTPRSSYQSALTPATTVVKFDRNDRPVLSIDPCGAKTRTKYDALGRRTSITDALNRTTLFAYDAVGRLTETTYPDGSKVSQEYNDAGQLVSMTDQLGNVSTRSYDNLGRLKETVDTEGYVTTYQQAWKGVRSGTVSTESAEHNKTRYLYDDLDRVITVTTATDKPEAASTYFTYDRDGNRLTSKDPRGSVTADTFDSLSRRTSSTDPLGRVTKWTYDTDSRTTTTILPDGRFNSAISDALGRTVKTIDAAGQAIEYTYDGLGDRKTSLTDSRGKVTTWSFDPCGQLLSKTYADQTTEFYKYNKAHQLKLLTRADGKKIRYSYDLMSRQIGINYRDAATGDVTKTYDIAGRLLTETVEASARREGSSVAYEYSPRGQAIQEVHTIGRYPFTIGRSYSGDGNLAQLVYPDGSIVNYGYSGTGHLASVTDANGAAIATYERERNGLVSQLSLGNRTFTNKTYDAANQLLGIYHSRQKLAQDDEPDSIDSEEMLDHPNAPTMQIFGSHQYRYDTGGRRTDQTFANGKKDAYSYDLTDQVIKADYGHKNANDNNTQEFSYDPMGNRLSFVDRGRTTLYSANDVNQYTAVTAPTSPPSGAWSYDLRGNLLSDGTQRHKWDLENRLLSSNRPGTKKVEYTYDSRSRRTTRTQDGNTTYYIYEGWNVIAEYQGSAGAPPSSTKRHIWGTDLTETLQGAGGVGGLLRTDFATSTTAYFHYDGNGNVTELSNEKGRRSARYRYDAFGNTIVARGKQSEANQYRFSTKPFDEANGLYYYGYRLYDPVSGRWPSRDPISERGDINLYRVVRNRTINSIDLLGLMERKTITRKTDVHFKLIVEWFYGEPGEILPGKKGFRNKGRPTMKPEFSASTAAKNVEILSFKAIRSRTISGSDPPTLKKAGFVFEKVKNIVWKIEPTITMWSSTDWDMKYHYQWDEEWCKSEG